MSQPDILVITLVFRIIFRWFLKPGYHCLFILLLNWSWKIDF